MPIKRFIAGNVWISSTVVVWCANPYFCSMEICLDQSTLQKRSFKKLTGQSLLTGYSSHLASELRCFHPTNCSFWLPDLLRNHTIPWKTRHHILHWHQKPLYWQYAHYKCHRFRASGHSTGQSAVRQWLMQADLINVLLIFHICNR
jgi:hypothetical protein